MDVEGKWVHFDDNLELHMFVSECTSRGIKCEDHQKADYFFEEDLRLYHAGTDRKNDTFACGYFVMDNTMTLVFSNSGKLDLPKFISEVEDRFTLE
jgi:hypothetical protein